MTFCTFFFFELVSSIYLQLTQIRNGYVSFYTKTKLKKGLTSLLIELYGKQRQQSRVSLKICLVNCYCISTDEHGYINMNEIKKKIKKTTLENLVILKK